jgi:hypothetical protein
MKKLYATIGIFIATLLSAQVPQAFSYQTIAFNTSGAPIANGNVALRISILDNSATGTVLYTETHIKTTNSKGLVNLNIGQGTATAGTFGAINWGTNTKFVKVEMDPQGGTNYTNVGVNQLMSVPYAQVSKTVVTGAGQGITLVSPNGTNYTLNVSDAGTLSLPQSATGNNSSLPFNLYLYGSYNSFNPANAELFRVANTNKYGYKYFPANTQLKFIAGQNASAQVYGTDTNNTVIPNGNGYTASSNGFYAIKLYTTGMTGSTVMYSTNLENFTPLIDFIGSTPPPMTPLTYNVSTNTFSTQVSGVTNNNSSFVIQLNEEELGDNLNDGNFDIEGAPIIIPNTTSTPKNYQINFKINFDGTGTYTITQI